MGLLWEARALHWRLSPAFASPSFLSHSACHISSMSTTSLVPRFSPNTYPPFLPLSHTETLKLLQKPPAPLLPAVSRNDDLFPFKDQSPSLRPPLALTWTAPQA